MVDLSKIHKHKPYDPSEGVNVPKDFEVRHSDYTLRFKKDGLQEVAEFNEIPLDMRKELWDHLQTVFPKKIEEDANKGTISMPKDPLEAVQTEIDAFRKNNPNLPDLTTGEIEKLFQQI